MNASRAERLSQIKEPKKFYISRIYWKTFTRKEKKEIYKLIDEGVIDIIFIEKIIIRRLKNV